MKIITVVLTGALLSVSARAEFRSWTRKDGKTADLELLSTSGSDEDKSGEFKMRNGRKVTLKASALAEEDAKLLGEWKPEAEAGAADGGGASVFDDLLEGNMLTLQGKRLKKCKEFVKPKKYYLFYYTASWCGPCQKFTPSLVEFYDKYKPKSDDFEIVLITSDRDEDSMESYAVSKRMKWPHLKLSKVDRFKKKFQHPGGGIPNLVLTDLQGELLKTSYEGKSYKGPTVVMNHLESLLSK